MNWKMPVASPHRIIAGAREHNLTSTLCGIDVVSASAQPHRWLYAMAEGTVEYIHTAYDARYRKQSDTYHSYGRFVVTRHDADGVTIYVRLCNNDKIDAALGDVLPAGGALGIYGTTGNSDISGAHVHIDMWIAESDIAAAASMGLVQPPGRRVESPWPGAPLLCNVDPTDMLTAAGLGVINRGA